MYAYPVIVPVLSVVPESPPIWALVMKNSRVPVCTAPSKALTAAKEPVAATEIGTMVSPPPTVTVGVVGLVAGAAGEAVLVGVAAGALVVESPDEAL